MTDPQRDALTGLLMRVRGRWRTARVLRVWRIAATAAASVSVVAYVAARLLSLPEPWPLVLLAPSVTAVLAALVWTAIASRRIPGGRQVARYIEERCPELEDTLATALAWQERPDTSPVAAAVVADAERRASALDIDRVVSRASLRQAAGRALAATVALALVFGVVAGPAWYSARQMAVYLFPARLGLSVEPGDVRIRAGESLEISARVPGAIDTVTPTLLIDAPRTRDVDMQPSGGRFVYRLSSVDEDFTYSVTAGRAESPVYTVTVLRPPRVERIDLRYEYPPAFRMEPRVEEDGGDIYGPEGTRVHVRVHTDKPVTSGALTLSTGSAVTLAARGDVLEGELTIADDGSYRVAIADGDGLRNPGETEYFIRTLEDRPPDVRVIRPASDRQVTPLEEVSIEARADDDFGIAALELVYAVRGGQEHVVPLQRATTGTTASGQTTIYLEDLKVAPGDFVTYYARARDVSRGKRSSEARSDIFFLEVSPFEEEFVASTSQGASGGDRGMDDLVGAQKDLIAATWKLDRRGRDTGGASAEDIRAVATAQGELRNRVLAAAAQMQRNADVRRRRPGEARPTGLPQAEPSETALVAAAQAMLDARRSLDSLQTSPALPFEMKALNELLRAQSDVRQREVQRQQNGGGGGRAANRQQQDLSSLFDRELARQQRTNYETPRATTESRPGASDNEAAERVKELAQRQEAINRDQQKLGGSALTDEQRKRELERLTREQNDLRQQVEALARQQEQKQTGSALQGVSDEMRGAASELRRQDARQAGERGNRALEQLKRLEQQLRGDPGTAGERSLAELQHESQEIADAQRQLAGRGQQPSGAPQGTTSQVEGQPFDGAQGKRAAEQTRLAERMQQLEQTVRQQSQQRNGNDAERQALNETSREFSRRSLSERMRRLSRTQDSQVAEREAQEIARQLEGVAERLGAATRGGDEARQLRDELERIRELRERLADVDRRLAEQNGADQQQGEGRGQQPGDGENAWDESRQLLETLKQDGGLGLTPGDTRGFNPGRSAPGTEAWKQDFARWDELKVQLALALQKAEANTAARLRQQQANDRLNAGASQTVPEIYRRLVERYYRALADKGR